MKIGKAAKRFGGPSASFRERKIEDDRKAAEQLRLAARTVPAEGPLSVFLDDVRTAPPGWVLVLDGASLETLLDAEGARVERLSLDWHLGSGVPDGDTVATALAERFGRDPAALPLLEELYFHSDKREAALDMFRTVRRAIPLSRKYDIHMDVGKPA